MEMIQHNYRPLGSAVAVGVVSSTSNPAHVLSRVCVTTDPRRLDGSRYDESHFHRDGSARLAACRRSRIHPLRLQL